MSSLPSSFNPSDYESLIKTVTQGNTVSKAQSLKRLITLVASDKKQFSIYAKRIILAIQDLMFEQKDNVNLLVITLILEIINLNPREIQYYIRSRLLNNMVKNLGDSVADIRKKSHYCLLAYVKTYKSFADIIQVYLTTGINSDEWQLRQKSINSFQSILIMEMKYMNWSSPQFKKLFEILLNRLKDQSAYVQKASEQCLISLIKMQQLRVFSKTLSPQHFNIIKNFCEAQFEAGNIIQINLEIQQKKQQSYHKNKGTQNQPHQRQSERTSQNQNRTDTESPQKRAILNRIQQIRKRNTQTPKKPLAQNQQRVALKKAQSVIMVNHAKQMKKNSSTQVIIQKPKNQIKLQPIKRPRKQSGQEQKIQPNFVSKQQKVENILGRKLIQDLKNDKDWKVRLDAVQELQARFQIYKQTFDIQAMTKTFLPVLVKLLSDMNFKVALISLKLIEQIMHIPKISLEGIVPQLMQKLSDNKIALRQSISRLIKIQYSRKKEDVWIDHLLLQIKKASNSNIKQQILGILNRLYQQSICLEYNALKVVQSICPLMDDLKTKIKIKTLDLLVLITIKNQNQDELKNVLMSKLNQVYYEMYLEKLNKELKNNKKQNSISIFTNSNESTPNNRATSRNTAIGNRRYSKLSGNSTSTSLQRDKNNAVIQPNSTARTSSFLERPDKRQGSNRKSQESQNNNTQSKISLHDPQSDSDKKKSILKSFRKKTHKTFDYKSTNYSSSQQLQPFSEPDKQLKTILVQIKSEDWQVAFQALNKTKRIIQHHRDLLNQSVIKQLTPDLMRLVENLRSSLSKNAVLTLNDLSNKVKRHLDSQLDLIFNKLIKKTLDANSFISDEVKKVMVSICSNCNQSKVLSLLTASHTTRAIPIKQVIAHILQNIVFLPKVYQKQLQRVVIILNDFMSEGSLQIRQKTKAVLNQIIASQKGKSILRLISSQHMAKLRKIVQQKIPQLKIVQATNQQVNNPVENQEMSSPHIKKKKKQKIQVFPQQFNALEGLLQKCQSSDWKIRSQSMTQIYQVCSKYPQEASQHRLNSKFIDVLSKQIGDPNIKVATNALKIFKQLTSLIPILIQNNLSVILNEVFNCFASQKSEVKVLSEEIFDQIAKNVQQWMLLQHMCNGVLYGVQKSKATILQKLIGLVPDTCKVKPNIFQKNVFPMINKTVQQGKPDLVPSLKRLINQCYNQIGDNCIDYLKPKSKQLLN